MTTKRSTTARHVTTAGLQPLARRFKTWRASRPRGQRIPAGLWGAAVTQARQHGLNAVVAALKVNYYDWQRRLSVGAGPARPRGGPPLFVEVGATPILSDGGESGALEWTHPSGVRLSVRVPAARVTELLPVVEVLLRHGR